MAQVYKAGQGMLTRRMAFWSLVIVIVTAGLALYKWLVNLSGGNTFFADPLIENFSNELPLLPQRLDWAFVTSWGLVALGVYLLYRWISKPKPTDFLLETDEEFKKVTWPSWTEAWNYSLLVIVFVVFLAALLWFSDIILNKLVDLILGGGPST